MRVTTATSDAEGVAAVSWIESLMIRRPFGSIDPNSIRETELHTECRRRHSRGESESLHSPQHDRVRDAARQRAAATRRMETDEARAERCVCVIACMWAAVRTWCGGEMSTSNAMLLRFASEVPYGFRGRQRFCASKASSSHIKAVFAPIREQHTRGRTSLPGLVWCGQE